MSDETPPTPLRLRPRQRSESETPPAAPAETEEGKLRLKPKLGVETEAETPVEAEPAEDALPQEPVRTKPKLTLEPDPEPQPEQEPVAEEAPAELPPAREAEEQEQSPPPMPEEGKVKLKIKVPGAAAQETPAPAEEELVPPSLPPFPVVAPPPPEPDEIESPPLLTAAAPGTRPPILAGGSRPAVFKRPRIPAALLAAEKRKRAWKLSLIALGCIVLGAAILGAAYLKFTPPPPTKVPTRPAYIAPHEPVVTAPVPEKIIPKVQPLPTEPVSNERVATTATVELAPGVTATSELVKAVPNASSAFRSYVASVKISGVYQGNPPRAFINGRLFRTGEMVDDVQEIYFDSIDAPSRSLIFKDARGATVSRRY